MAGQATIPEHYEVRIGFKPDHTDRAVIETLRFESAEYAIRWIAKALVAIQFGGATNRELMQKTLHRSGSLEWIEGLYQIKELASFSAR